jgi:hypothetical protein
VPSPLARARKRSEMVNAASTAVAAPPTKAAKALVMLDLAVFKAELETGMFKKPGDVIAREFRYDPLPAEVRTVVIAAWTRGGLLPRTAIEQMVPERIPQESLPRLSSPA